MTEYYVSGCIDNGSEVETCDDSEATFWTLYERDAEGLSQGIIDCKFREDAEAAMRVYQQRDVLQQQVNKLAAEPVAVPDGWRLVPVEPTMKQLTSGRKATNGTGKMSHLMQQRLSDIYRAMLAAAPTP